jgi:hypothetical protein
MRDWRLLLAHIDETLEEGFKSLSNGLSRKVGGAKRKYSEYDYRGKPIALNSKDMALFRSIDKEILRLYGISAENYISTWRIPNTISINRYSHKVQSLSKWLSLEDPLLYFHLEYADYCRARYRRRLIEINASRKEEDWNFYFKYMANNLPQQMKDFVLDNMKEEDDCGSDNWKEPF